ncbi:ankyrin repeat domain-containing protein [Flavobacterium sp. 9AF]|uniref:ankyrin repeat domain-containing protein n=1 Tax=Flavobacterium sp. 9AF TaxID=2653142 RepID=UPI00135C1CCF|nr:hypothetical protein [Flavobacterium sp. 9AF]
MKKIILFILLTTTLVQCQEDNPNLEYRFDNFKNTPLSEFAEAVKKNDTFLIREIIENKKVDVNYNEPNYGLSLLVLSIANDKAEAFKSLIRYGANVNAVCGIDFKTTPLLTAILFSENCNTFYVEHLLKNGSNVNYVLNDGLFSEDKYDQETPLFESVGKLSDKGLFCDKISQILIENGANLNQKKYIDPFKEKKSIIDICLIHKNLFLLYYLFKEDLVEVPKEIELETIDGIEKISLIEYLKSEEFDFPYSPDFKNKRDELVKLIEKHN